jgi:hypothetical protein
VTAQREAVHELQEDVTDHQNALDTVMDLVEQSVTVDQASELVRDYCSRWDAARPDTGSAIALTEWICAPASSRGRR